MFLVRDIDRLAQGLCVCNKNQPIVLRDFDVQENTYHFFCQYISHNFLKYKLAYRVEGEGLHRFLLLLNPRSLG